MDEALNMTDKNSVSFLFTWNNLLEDLQILVLDALNLRFCFHLTLYLKSFSFDCVLNFSLKKKSSPLSPR